MRPVSSSSRGNMCQFSSFGKGLSFCAHFSPASALAAAVILDTMIMVSIFVILALGLLTASVQVPAIIILPAVLIISLPCLFHSPKEQPQFT